MAARTKDEEEVDLLRIPSSRKMEKLRDIMENDEDFRFDRIRLDNKKPRYELPEPTDEDEDNVEMKGTFRGVVVLARKNFFLSDEDKKKGVPAKEKRALYVLRPGKLFPELLYVSPTGVRAWKALCKEVVEQGQQYFHVLIEFDAEFIDNSKKTGYKWSKPTFKIVRTLTDEELGFIDDLHELTDSRVKEWEDASDLDEYEEAALTGKKPSKKEEEDEEDEEKVIDKHRKATRNKVNREDDDDEDEQPRKKSTKKAADDDDEDEQPKSRKKKATADDDDEEEEKPRKKSTKKAADDDDEDEQPKSRRKSSKKAADDDDEEDNGKSSKGRKGYPSLDDDD